MLFYDLQNERRVREETESELFSHNLTGEGLVKFTRSKSPKIVNSLSFRILLRGKFVSQYKIKVVLLSVKKLETNRDSKLGLDRSTTHDK